MDPNLLTFVACLAIGFIAQMVDGALGMAYGVTSNAFLLSIGLEPKFASASVHAAEVATTAVSGLSHFKIGNVDREVFRRLVLPGVIGGVVGAYILTEIEADIIKLVVSIYLVIMGAVILLRAFRRARPTEKTPPLVPLGLAGGFLDAVGGGGWGPVVTTTLVGSGYHPRFAIGSVNMAEFFVTLARSITFILALGTGMNWFAILGLLLGGLPAAPLAALVSKRVAPQRLMLLVGGLIIFLSVRNVLLALNLL
ncbi:MAG: sulfite exporter TauE/SafE family protein [Anaerolineae bacterium]|nr:sulfite exporter TauE/SafE family protein [Anaerolineae bacterium]